MFRKKAFTAAFALTAPLLPLAVSAAAPPPASAGYVWRNVDIDGGGGYITGIFFHPRQPGLIYCRTDIGGVYRYDAKPGRWTALTDWVGSANGNWRGAESLAIDPTNAQRVYVAAGTYLQPNLKCAILRSSDQGRSWKATPIPVEMGGNADGRGIGERLAVDPNRPSVLYFGSRQDGLWRSADYGATFKKVAGFPDVPNDAAQGAGYHPPQRAGIGFIVFDAHRGVGGEPTPVIYAGLEAPELPGLMRSVDGGASWHPVPGQPPAGLMPQHAAIDRAGMLYVTYTNSLGPNGVASGAVWKMNTRTGRWTEITPVAMTPDRSGGYSGLSLDLAHPGTLVVSTIDHWNPGDDVFHTTDGGARWYATRALSTQNPGPAKWLNWGKPAPTFGWWTTALALDPFHPGHVLYGTGATIWGTDDIAPADSGEPTHWHMSAEGLEETAATALVSPPSGAPLVSGLGDIGGFTHEDLTVSPPGGMPTPLMTTTSGLDFAALKPSVMARVGSPNNDGGHGGAPGACSADGGRTWQAFASMPEGARGSGSIGVAADGSALVWAASGAPVSFSRDGGATWQASGGLGAGGGGDQDYFRQGECQIVADRVDPARFYAFDKQANTLYVSGDGGASFRACAALPERGGATLKAAPDHAGDVWLEQGGRGLTHSTDAGATFEKVDSVAQADGLGFGKPRAGGSYPALYLVGRPSATGAAYGIYRSDDAGTTWTRLNDDAHQYGWIGEPVTGDPRVYGRVYVGTNGRGVVYGEPAHLSAPSGHLP